MTTATIVHAIEEAAQFGDRFPDLSEQDVLEHIEYVLVLRKLDPQYAISRVILRAYDYASVAAGVDCAKLWGVIPDNFVYEPERLYQ